MPTSKDMRLPHTPYPIPHTATMTTEIVNKWQLVLNHQCLLGEGPVWDAENKSILWVDILNGEIHQYLTIIKQHKVITVGQPIGAIGLTVSGGLIAAVKNGFAKIDAEKETIELLNNPEEGVFNNRFNDGKCDPAGNFWAGTMDDLNSTEGAGNLYMLHADLSISRKIERVSCSNGMAWSRNGNIFYYIDSPTRQVVAYDFDAGNITNKRVIITIPPDQGLPDGMTIDTEGMLWVAHWDGWKVSRWNPVSGELLVSFRLPAARITSCAFGGDKLQDLYITSAFIGLSESERDEQPLAGSLFVIRECGYEGAAVYKFRG